MIKLPLPTPGRSRPAWRVLRALDEIAGADWSWRDQPEHVAQLAQVAAGDVVGHLRKLAAEGLIDVGACDATHISGTWRAHPRAELRALLALIRGGLAPLHSRPPCAAEGIGRARCELEAGHAGQHIDGGHPALRRGEILSWEKG